MRNISIRPASPSDRDTHQRIMQAILSELPERHRDAICEYYANGVTAAQAAEAGSMGVLAFKELKAQVRARFDVAVLRGRVAEAIRFNAGGGNDAA